MAKHHSFTLGVLTVSLLFLVSIPTSGLPCTVLATQVNDSAVLARTLDWEVHLPGMVLVNPRGLEKSVLAWHGYAPDPVPRDSMTWIARYMSITFTGYGRDFITSGMNEAGLMVAGANAPAEFLQPDNRPGMSCFQWIQAQLDLYASVAEVLDGLDRFHVDGESWHILFSDKSGECLAVEFIADGIEVIQGVSLPLPVLTNATCPQLAAHLPLDESFGGTMDLKRGDDSFARYLRVAEALRDQDTSEFSTSEAYAFHLLELAQVSDTQRWVVFNSATGQVTWKTSTNGKLCWLTFNDLLEEASALVRWVPIDAPGAGDISAELKPCTYEDNRTVVSTIVGEGRITGKTGAAHPELEFDVESIARHPGWDHVDEEKK